MTKIGLGSLLNTDRYFSSEAWSRSCRATFSKAAAMRLPISSRTLASRSGKRAGERPEMRMTPKVWSSLELMGR